ncbi:MAG TPA: hypothetical protein VMS40_25370 [Vicinamibacterales bacterium]|nr:hypothetical protein [Vicinamibacterales bacterium]
MAIQGIFLADFSQYNAAVDGADAKLRKFTSTTDQHDQASKRFSTTTTQTSSSFGQLSQGLSTADKTLAAFGVHIGPEIHALEELSQATGKTATEIGAVGTASLVAAAALGGWEIGRTIAKFFELDTAIANTTARWLGYGDVVAETAGAKQDSINLAISHGAAVTTTYTEAVKLNAEWAGKSSERAKEHAKATEDAAKASDAAAKAIAREAEALQKLQDAYTTKLQGMSDDLFGNDAISKATDWVTVMGRVENVENLNVEALGRLRESLFAGLDAMVAQGQAGSDLANTFTQFIVAVDQAAASHTTAITQMETDEQRFARENAELAQAMKDNFVVIGQSAQEAARTITLSWNDALAAVREGQGTLGGAFQSVAPGTPGSTVRYDDYGNPYGYIPGVNNPGNISPSGGGTHNIFVDASQSFFDSPADAQRLADKVKYALGTQAASQGGR